VFLCLANKPKGFQMLAGVILRKIDNEASISRQYFTFQKSASLLAGGQKRINPVPNIAEHIPESGVLALVSVRSMA
jgi:hypothetical protein